MGGGRAMGQQHRHEWERQAADEERKNLVLPH